MAGLEEEVRLMVLAEDSEEFADTVHHFYRTLEELHSQISIVQVGLGMWDPEGVPVAEQ